jgi:hypothetical protein
MKLTKALLNCSVAMLVFCSQQSLAGTVESVNYACQISAEQRCINEYYTAIRQNRIQHTEWINKIYSIERGGMGNLGVFNLIEVCKSGLNPYLSQCRVTAEVPTTEQTQKMIDDMKKSFAEEIAKVLEKQRDEVANLINGAKKE